MASKMKRLLRTVNTMKAEYDLSRMKSRKNPYAAKLKKPVSMRLSEDVVDYFKSLTVSRAWPTRRVCRIKA